MKKLYKIEVECLFYSEENDKNFPFTTDEALQFPLENKIINKLKVEKIEEEKNIPKSYLGNIIVWGDNSEEDSATDILKDYISFKEEYLNLKNNIDTLILNYKINLINKLNNLEKELLDE